MNELNTTTMNPRKALLFGSIWLSTTILAVISFLAGRRVVLGTLSRFFASGSSEIGPDPSSLMNILVSFTLAFLGIAVIIGGFEYHFRKAGTEESWWMFTRTLAVEFGILLVALFI
jgi:hypothetical protein